MVPEAMPGHGEATSSPFYRAILVTDVGGGEKPVLGDENIVIKAGEFRAALIQALDREQFGSADNNAPFRLKAFIVEVTRPYPGFSQTTDSFVRYTLIRSRDGQVVFDEVVRSTFTSMPFDAPLQIIRVQLAREETVRASISALLDRLRSAEMSQ
ncbi:hypothetical protein [Reyranella sp.]|uniref:hypothetical protein n=1 Tax=Reyranella sp. TaxID=1929291 RepID=UPI003D096318